MSGYRVYVLGIDGHFVRTIQLDCANDEAAIESATQFVNDYGLELWQEERLVKQIQNATK